MRGDYLVISWHPQDDAATRTAGRIEAALLRETDIDIIRAEGLMIATQSARVEQVAPAIFLMGDLFGTPYREPWPRPRATDQTGFEDYCSGLLTSHWGSYIALRHDPRAPIFLSVFAEPIGSRACDYWQHDGVTMVGCDADRWLDRFPPANLGLDLEEIAQVIHYPSQAAETAPLSGIASLQTGAVTCFLRSAIKARRLWTPRDHCVPNDRVGDPATLALIVDASVAAWSSTYGKPIVELSGGLDSAIVAAGLVRAGHDGLEAFTFFSDSLEGDERRFSRAAAERLQLVAHELAFEISAMDESLLDDAAVGVRPGIGSTTFFHDRQLAGIGEARGADALFTGRGGDALFFQHPTPLVVRDRRQGGKVLSLERLEGLARWCQTNVWGVAISAYFPAMPVSPATASQNRFCLHASHSRPSTWAGPLEGVSRGKRMQIEAIAGDRNAFGPSRCAQKMRVIHPLLSQPIVEYVLGQSLMTLTQGRRDRAMARAAYADRLPAALIERRGKGALSCFFGQTLARSAPLLRTHLLEGALAEAKLVDRKLLEQALDPEYLVRSGCYGEIIRLLVIERWMRGWKGRLQQPMGQCLAPGGDYPEGSRLPAHRSPEDLRDCR